MKIIIAMFALTMSGPALAETQPVEPSGGTVSCNHRPTTPGCPYWCKFHKDDVRCKAAK